MCARPKAGRAVAGGVRARACGAGQAGAGASECWWGGSRASVPRGDSPATDRTCPRASLGLAYICEGLKEQRKGLATLVLWNNQLTHTGMAFLGMTLVSRPERGGGSAVRPSTCPTPGSRHLPAVAAPRPARPTSSGTCCLPPALFGLCFSFCTLFPLRKVALLSLSLCIQHHSLVQRFVRGENALHRKLAFLGAIRKS